MIEIYWEWLDAIWIEVPSLRPAGVGPDVGKEVLISLNKLLGDGWLVHLTVLVLVEEIDRTDLEQRVGQTAGRAHF